ncbi:hypothetical protein [Collinsella provencensis]|uniref:hypothetical protein n=1 Tax=Collinsella provencensis TaxID=1937461 RepID=UPI000C81C210|nr:hypothetical protein [Collinsella provencensis]
MERLRGWLASHRVQAAAAAAAAIILALCLGAFFVGGSFPDGKADAAGSDASVAVSGGDGADERGGSASADGKEGGPPAEASEGESSSTDSKSGSKGPSSPNSGNSNSGNSGSSGGSDKPSKPAHQHSWKQHTAQKWVSNMVTVPDYETQKVPVGTRYIFAYDGYSTTSAADAENHSVELILAGLPDNHRLETIYEEKQVQVGSHQEDHGHYETYVDYEYCDCGATR